MAGAMRKMAVYLGLVEDEEERYDEGYEGYSDYPEYADEPALRRYSAADERVGGPAGTATVRRFDDPSVTPLDRRPGGAPRREPHAPAVPEPYRITTLHPRTYNEARQIGEHFRDGVPVIMNLTEMDDVDAKRLVDFAAGLIFGLRGSIERVTNKVFLLSPQNVEVTAEDKARIVEGGFFNQS